MAAQALYRKWRSQTFEEVVGQKHVTRTLRNALRDGRVAHAYLFTGPRGTGKTSTARLLAKAVNCLHGDPSRRPDNECSICLAITEGTLLDLVEIDAASNRGIDEIRDLREKVHFAPSQSRFKVYVIDEVHMLTSEAFNALLKTLEEPPPHVIFVLATTEPHKIPDTVLSRCQRFDFRRISAGQIADHLAFILEQEGRVAQTTALEMIARSAEGSMRDAISLVDQLLSYGGDIITEDQVRAVRGTIPGQAVADLVNFLAGGETVEGLALINQMAGEGTDLRQLAIQLTEHLRAVLLTCVGGSKAGAILVDFPPEQLGIVQAQAGQFEVSELGRVIRLFNQAGLEMRDAVQPQLCLELAWLDAVQPVVRVEEQKGAAVADPSMFPGVLPTIAGEGRPETPAQAAAPAQGRQPTATPVFARAPAPVADEDVVATLRARWTELLQAAEAAGGGSLRGALRTLRNVVAQGGDIYFAFEREFARATVERPANKEIMQDLLERLLGRPVRLRCQVGQEVTGVEPASEPALAPAPKEVGADDPVVEHARRALGAVPSALERE